MEAVHHSLGVLFHILIAHLAIDRRQPRLFLAAIKVEPLQELGIFEFQVHCPFFIQRNVKELALNILGSSFIAGALQRTTQRLRSRQISVQVLEHLFGIQAMLCCQLVKQRQNSVLHALGHFGVHILENDMDIVKGKVIVGQFIHHIQVFAPQITGVLVQQFRVL